MFVKQLSNNCEKDLATTLCKRRTAAARLLLEPSYPYIVVPLYKGTPIEGYTYIGGPLSMGTHIYIYIYRARYVGELRYMGVPYTRESSSLVDKGSFI